MSCGLRSLSFDVRDPAALATFWARVLHRDVGESGTELLPAGPSDVAIRFCRRDDVRQGLGRAHFDLTSATAAEQDSTVALALDLGASHIDVGQLPEEGHVVLADPEGNEFCVIEAGNGFLADTARIGALSCDGTRAVGLFWSEALAWPLVWDEGEETAIQSPAGGTKIAWGGPPVAAKEGLDKLRLDLVVTGDSTLDHEVERLVGLGARRLDLELEPGEVLLADPDDNEFSVVAQGSEGDARG